MVSLTDNGFNFYRSLGRNYSKLLRDGDTVNKRDKWLSPYENRWIYHDPLFLWYGLLQPVLGHVVTDHCRHIGHLVTSCVVVEFHYSPLMSDTVFHKSNLISQISIYLFCLECQVVYFRSFFRAKTISYVKIIK